MSSKEFSNRIGIVGAGAWGTALAFILGNAGRESIIRALESETTEDINRNSANSVFLPGVVLPRNITATCDLGELEDCRILVFAVPTQFVRSTLESVRFDIKDKIIINLAKGIEIGSKKRISEIFEEVKGVGPDAYHVMTGPSHAEEVARLTPTALVTASKDHANEELIRDTFSTDTFRMYSSDDVVGCEIAGAMKNVIAIAAGIIDGLGTGDNTKAALMTRGLAEITRLGIALGANPLTFSGLSGLGDLYVTCASRHSRNRYVGEQAGRGRNISEVLSEMKAVAEGVSTTRSAYELARDLGVDMPITEKVYKILFENERPKDAVYDLMNRETKRELY